MQSFEMLARIEALERRADAVERIAAELFGHFSAATDHNLADFRSGLGDLARRYSFVDDESDPGRRAAGLFLERVMDAYEGRSVV
ncbi:hypothetical protein [Brevundimonas nasdae]|uniref:hypothetical protein n=1 Tax=Brevundimonas nasdae TaxID=172043 RepID=UPI003F690E1A